MVTGGVPLFRRSRPSYPTTRDHPLSHVIFLTTPAGDAWSGLVEVRRPFRGGWFFNASYLYGKSTATMEGTSSQAASNWGNVLIANDPNNPPVGRSVYDPGHRINYTMSYEIPFFGGATGTASLYYSGQSGRPFTLTYFGDVNGDGRTSNDLLYIPASASEVTFTAELPAARTSFRNAAGDSSQDHNAQVCRSPCQPGTTIQRRAAVQRVKAEISIDSAMC